MPKKPKRSMSAAGRSQSGPLADAHAKILAQFDRMITDSLGPVLGKARLASIRSDLAIASSVGGGVVVHAALKTKSRMTLARIAKERPIVGVLANSIPLIDPITLTALKPGAHVVRIRQVGKDRMVFDFFDDRDRPVFSTVADPTQQIPPDAGVGLDGILDVEFEWPWDPDSLKPPVDRVDGLFCISFLSWKKCWDWNWPEIKWPW